ncbi:type II secretion system protein [Clostridium sp. D2Q-11]|uniref:Type II secretion system protein n=1 Tax=Anaeromonas frigoriresistens TaxID=2683708 RepID=A0A942UVU8_9FIRM|nr:type II secretion system protein [Anaeromonas frigoriresistens]MBS4540003.1 type II secretion system protein [Anaeromonas frigoriresistens]
MNNKGITIIELIFVLLIVGIIIAITLPRLDFSDQELRSCGRQLVSDLNHIKTKSQVAGNSTDNLIILDEKYYFIKLNGKSHKNVNFKSNYKITNNMYNEVKFYASGSPVRAGTILIFNNNNNKYIEITITPGTGRIHMYDKIRQGYKKDWKNGWKNKY